jgi:hypothetical protein
MADDTTVTRHVARMAASKAATALANQTMREARRVGWSQAEQAVYEAEFRRLFPLHMERPEFRLGAWECDECAP